MNNFTYCLGYLLQKGWSPSFKRDYPNISSHYLNIFLTSAGHYFHWIVREVEWVLNNLSPELEAALIMLLQYSLGLISPWCRGSCANSCAAARSQITCATVLAHVPMMSRQTCSAVFSLTLHRKLFRNPGLWSSWLPFKILSGNSCN